MHGATEDRVSGGSSRSGGASPIEAVPQCLDAIITKNRHLARCALSAEPEVAALTGFVSSSQSVRGEISDWRFVTYEATAPGHGSVLHVHVLGALGELSWMTSPLVAIDRGAGRVETNSGSIYVLAGAQGVGEPTMPEILHVGAWGRGEILGVLPAFN